VELDNFTRFYEGEGFFNINGSCFSGRLSKLSDFAGNRLQNGVRRKSAIELCYSRIRLMSRSMSGGLSAKVDHLTGAKVTGVGLNTALTLRVLRPEV
jgi:hypothetical protein